MGSVISPQVSLTQQPPTDFLNFIVRARSCVHAIAARDAGRVNLGHYDKPLYQEVGLAGKEKGIRSGFE